VRLPSTLDADEDAADELVEVEIVVPDPQAEADAAEMPEVAPEDLSPEELAPVIAELEAEVAAAREEPPRSPPASRSTTPSASTYVRSIASSC
jgi:hypothetical protein